MNILEIQEAKDRGLVKAISTLAAATYWSWYFYYQYLFPEVHDFLVTRIILCLYCLAIILFFKKRPESPLSTIRFLFNVGLFLFLTNEALVVYLNPQKMMTLFTFFGMGLIVSSSALRFKDFFIFALITTSAPLIINLINPFYEIAFLIHWTISTGVVLSVIGYCVHTRLSYKIEIQSAHLSSIQNAKMAALGEMASGMAHEINNPLTIIKAKTEQLLKKINLLTLPEKDKIYSDLLKINLTTDRIAKIIKSLKTFSRNSQNDPLVSVALDSLVQSTLQLCFEKINNEKIDLSIESIPTSFVLGKESEISQVLLNLISNSIDALENQTIKKIDIKFEFRDELTLIKVLDSGPPISDAIKNKLMDPFFTTKEIGKGTGLGLSISKRIVESFGGELYLLPNSEQTCFVLKLKSAAAHNLKAA
jgi:signal transduction histidine kinase